MLQISSREATWFASSQEFPCISRNPKAHYRTHKLTPPVSLLGEPNPVHIPTSHLLEILFVCCAMFPQETPPPPGDPTGGVVYLRNVLSPEQASRMWVFLNKFCYREGLLAPRPTPSWRTTPRRLSATVYSVNSQLPSLSEAVPLSATWGRAMSWWQGSTTWHAHIYII